MARAAHIVVAMVIGACGGEARVTPATPAAPPTLAERMLAMLPPGAQVVIELDLARLRANPVVGAVVTRALAERTADLPAGVPASPLAAAEHVVLAAYGVGTAQAATVTVLAAPRELPGTTKIAEGFYVVGPPDWVSQVEQRVALSTTGEAKFAIHAAPELLALRGRAMPASAPGAALRVTARLSFDARIALARQTGLDAAPAQLSAWGDVVDDLALIVDCDAADPGNRADPKRAAEAPRRLEAALRGAIGAIAEEPMMRLLGLPASLNSARLTSRGTWVRTIIAVGPTRLRRVAERAATLLREATPAEPPGSPAVTPAASPTAPAASPSPIQTPSTPPTAAAPRGPS